ncbi:MAG TPA: PIN domain-containing protein [Solirubrobacteraceae bacterium]|nr:PIN domain-containing protein [Solirubrobacteraceae bacterium]
MTEPAGQAGSNRAVLDACTLFPASLRGVLLSVAEQEVFRPVWSEPILGEVQGALVKTGVMESNQARGLTRAMRDFFPGAMVAEQPIREIESHMPNDLKDRHVLAAAVVSGTPVVVTQNLKDFRAQDLATVGVRAIHPDAFLTGLLGRAPEAIHEALQFHVESMRASGRWTTGQLLGHLQGMGRGKGLTPTFARAAAQRLGIRATTPPPPDQARDRTGLNRSRGRQPRER